MDEYIIFNKKNSSGSKKSEDPTVVFSPKGLVTLNAALMELIGLDDKSKIIFLKKKDSKDWYISRHYSEDAFSIRKYKSGKGAGFNCSMLTQTVFKDIAGAKVNGKPFNETKAIRFNVNAGIVEIKIVESEKLNGHLILISTIRQ